MGFFMLIEQDKQKRRALKEALAGIKPLWQFGDIPHNNYHARLARWKLKRRYSHWYGQVAYPVLGGEKGRKAGMVVSNEIDLFISYFHRETNRRFNEIYTGLIGLTPAQKRGVDDALRSFTIAEAGWQKAMEQMQRPMVGELINPATSDKTTHLPVRNRNAPKKPDLVELVRAYNPLNSLPVIHYPVLNYADFQTFGTSPLEDFRRVVKGVKFEKIYLDRFKPKEDGQNEA